MSIVYIHNFLVIYTFHLTYFIWLYAASLSPYRMGPDSSRIFERVCFLSLLTSLLRCAKRGFRGGKRTSAKLFG